MSKPKRKLPIIAACHHARRKKTRNAHYVAEIECEFGDCWNKTYRNYVMVAPLDPSTPPIHLPVDATPAQIQKRNSTFISICNDCFKFATWHIEHKWTILALLSRAYPAVSRNAWTHVEKFLWCRH